MRNLSLAVILLSALVISSCQKPNIMQGKILGGEVHILADCTASQMQLTVRSRHNLKIKNLKLRKLDSVDEDWFDSNSARSPKPASYPAGHGKTRWDISLGLQTASESSIMTVDLQSTGQDKLEFISKEYAITAGDKGSISRFCVMTGYNSQHVQILALFDPALTGKEDLSSINIGINVFESNSGYSIPIHIDPNVKNNG